MENEEQVKELAQWLMDRLYMQQATDNKVWLFIARELLNKYELKDRKPTAEEYAKAQCIYDSMSEEEQERFDNEFG